MQETRLKKKKKKVHLFPHMPPPLSILQLEFTQPELSFFLFFFSFFSLFFPPPPTYPHSFLLFFSFFPLLFPTIPALSPEHSTTTLLLLFLFLLALQSRTFHRQLSFFFFFFFFPSQHFKTNEGIFFPQSFSFQNFFFLRSFNSELNQTHPTHPTPERILKCLDRKDWMIGTNSRTHPSSFSIFFFLFLDDREDWMVGKSPPPFFRQSS